MSTCPAFTHLLVIPHLHVQNANAISSPLTHGFPSMTAFLGLMWALERKTRKRGMDLEFNAVGVICHDHDEQVVKDSFVKTFRLTRNPVGKDGKTAAIVEEGRIHLDLSLVLAVHAGESWDADTQREHLAVIVDMLHGMRIAGGIVLPSRHRSCRRNQPWVADFTGDEEAKRTAFRQLSVRLLPGTTLVARDDLIDQRLASLRHQTPDATRLDAWLSLSRINWHYNAGTEAGKGEWQHDRTGLGWVVPIPVGYGALGDLHPAGRVANARDATTPFRFVESLYSMGEWVGPHRLNKPQDLLWYADSSSGQDVYRCHNDYRNHTSNH